jgi:hypothetical protein
MTVLPKGGIRSLMSRVSRMPEYRFKKQGPTVYNLRTTRLCEEEIDHAYP